MGGNPFYRLMAVTENPHRVDGTLLPIGAVYCIQPDTNPNTQIPKNARPISIDFVVSSTAVEAASGGNAYRLCGSDSQPKAQEVWGVDIPLILPEHLWPWLMARVRMISGLWWRGGREHFKANMRLNEILEHLTDVLLQGQLLPSSPTHSWLIAVERAAAERVASLQNVRDLAAIAGMSPAHFSRRFTEIVEKSPGAWLRQRRLAAAADLLRSSDLSIQNVALQVGFRRASALNQAWRAAYHCTPSEWRNRRLGR